MKQIRFLLLLIFCLFSSCGNGSSEPSVPKNINTHITINTQGKQNAIRPRFIGISFETWQICDLLMLDQTNTDLENVLKAIGPGVLRFGGRSEEYSFWQPDTQSSCSPTYTVINKTMLSDLFAFAQRIDWQIIWGMNFVKNTPTNMLAEARYIVSFSGVQLRAFTFGSEPELYRLFKLKPQAWTYSNYLSEWEAYRAALQNAFPDVPVGGPDICCDMNLVNSFLAKESTHLVFVSRHYYETVKDQNTTAAFLLSRTETDSEMFKTFHAAAKTSNLQGVIDETNSVSSGGFPGLSDTFAATLWSVDYQLNGLQNGINGFNFHNAENAAYQVIDTNGNITPMYYGLYLLRYITRGGTLIPSTIQTNINLTDYIVKVNDGTIRMVLVNKDLAKNAIVSINVPARLKKAESIRVLAPTVSSTAGITIGGNTIQSDGTWHAKAYEQLSISNNTAYITVPKASIAVITLS